MAFTHLKQAAPVATAGYTFSFLHNEPRLVVRFAGKGTPGFRSDEVKLANAHRTRGERLTERAVDESLSDDAKLIAKHCVVSWERVLEDDGSTAPCTPAKVEEFLLALVEHREDLFLEFRRFVRDAENFVGAPSPTSPGVELGKS
jgi:hypothetical protein